MNEIIFATGNENKVKEVKFALDGILSIKGLKDIGCTTDLPETKDTFEGNALQKAQYVVDNFKVDCFSEDTGLEIEALDMKPGIYTARYAGPNRDKNANMDLVLKNLTGKTNRKARFRTAIALIVNGKPHIFEGICNGKIATERMGNEGFGYDPIFIPDGFDRSFAQMSKAEKNEISHRGIAIRKLIAFLKDK